MSQVTNVILTTSPGEFQRQRIEEVNDALRGESGEYYNTFAPVPANEGSAVGGPKNMECDVYLAAFNYLSVERLLAAVRAAKWATPNSVQLFICDEDEYRFTEQDWRGAVDAALTRENLS